MNVQIRAKDLTLNDGIRAHIESAVESFSKYNLDITTVNVVAKTEKKGVAVEFDIRIAHATPVVINQSDEDLDTAIDLAIERATKSLRRLHDKVVAHGTDSIRDLEIID
ncbi:MAG: ribosome-associated translation inhibitor RaiA [Campylobacterales bacterium]|nr:ribosome-associated translation inhibitor RaiA [Campylobacterales bacterium]